MNYWQLVYKRNKELDNIFFEKYLEEKEMFEKNCIEFLVELGEFTNETKCFKYWSIKEPKYDAMLEELADVFTMLMYFYNILNLDITQPNIINKNQNLLELINETYYLGTKLYKELSKELLDRIFISLLKIAELLGIKEDEIIDAITKKQNIIEERLNTDY